VKALQLVGPRQAEVVEVPRPTAGPGEVLVRVRACGVCGSDLNAWRGAPGIEYPLSPGLPGHEIWGEVDGQTVTGLAQGGYAEYVVARADELVPTDGLLLGEPLACAANIARRAAINPDQQFVVVGFGYLAALVVLVLDPRRTRRWMAISRRVDSRALAERLGAAQTLPFEAVPSDWWDSFPVVIEAAGVQQSLDYATWLVGYGGRLVIAGYHADGPRTVNMQTWNWKGIDVINAHERRPEVYLSGLRSGLAIARQHHLDFEGLITHRWPLASVGDALSTADQRPAGFIKAIVQP
jgi:threonine dehydrogenase-like Zn-dependent dehydrogenase